MLAAAGAADGAQTSAKAIGPYLRITKLTETQHRIRQFGATVAASGDGQTVVVGSPFDTGAKGAAYVFSKRGAVWSSSRLSSGGGRFGSSVSISFDGRTVLIGAPAAGDDEFGAAWVFKNPGGGVWTGTKLKPYGADGDPGIGYSVALSGNGLMAVVGGPFDNRSAIRRPYTRKFGKGGAWLFRRSGATWRQFGGSGRKGWRLRSERRPGLRRQLRDRRRAEGSGRVHLRPEGVGQPQGHAAFHEAFGHPEE